MLQLDPTYPGAHLRLGEIHARRREMSQARKHLRAEVLLRPQDAVLLMDLANLLGDIGQNRAAVACFKRLVQIQPKNASAWQNLAVAQFLTGRYEDGMASCQEALNHDPANTMAMYNLALACEHLGRYDQGLTWVRRGLAVAAKDASLQHLELRIRVMRWRQRLVGGLRRLMRRRR